ncbi:MAG: hypothetical protein JWR83_3044 [Aeromicrobium sp.]|nr:hypothetical protein [Aeromicrobium sp.]
MRRAILALLATVVVIVAIGAAAVAGSGGGGSTVTRARLERSLPIVFSNLYVQQTRILGRDNVTAASLHPKAMCDKHGPDVADVGPGGDWICLMSWNDPEVRMPPEGYGKFELNVHSNDCYTAAGPTKLTGFLTITDTKGKDVTNPVFEFDGCFDPNASNTATGVIFPSLLGVASTTLTPDKQGHIGLQVTCGTGSAGCAGSVTAKAGSTALGTVPIKLKEEASATLKLPNSLPTGASEVTFVITMTSGAGPTGPVTVPVQGD